MEPPEGITPPGTSAHVATSMTMMFESPRFVTSATLLSAEKATPRGRLPTLSVAFTVSVDMSIRLAVQLYSLATTALLPSGETATPDGLLPTPMLVCTDCDAMLMTDTL